MQIKDTSWDSSPLKTGGGMVGKMIVGAKNFVELTRMDPSVGLF